MSVEVRGCGGDPGSQFADPGSAQVAVVVKPVQLFDDPVGRVGQGVVAHGEPTSLDGVVVRSTAVSGKDVIDVLLLVSLSELEPRDLQRLVDRNAFAS